MCIFVMYKDIFCCLKTNMKRVIECMDDLIKELNKKYKDDYTGLLYEKASIESKIIKNKLNNPNDNFTLFISIVSLGFAAVSLITTILVENLKDVEFIKAMVIGCVVVFITMSITTIVIEVILLQTYKKNVNSLILQKYAVDYLLEKYEKEAGIK